MRDGKTVNDYLFAYSSKKNQQTIKGIILAGGEGVRYADGEVPKVLQFFEGKPLMSHSIDSLIEMGIRDENISILINDEAKFADEIRSFVSGKYKEIICFDAGRKYRWEKTQLKGFGPISKAWAIAKYVDYLYRDVIEAGLSGDEWEDDILLILNADSIYPKKSLKIATGVAKKCFKVYSDQTSRHEDEDRFSALIYGLNTLETKTRRSPVLQEESILPFEIRMDNTLDRHFSVRGEVIGFQKLENNIESGIFAFKAGDLYEAICDWCELGRYVPVTENLNTLENVLYSIYLPHKEEIDTRDVGLAIDALLKELKKSGFNVAKYRHFKEAIHWSEIDDFDDLNNIRNDLIEIFESRAKEGCLENKLGSGLNFICNKLMTKDYYGKRRRVLAISSNMTYLNLNDMALRDKAKQFLGVLKTLSLSDEDLRDICAEHEDYVFGPKEIADAISWEIPIDLRFILDRRTLKGDSHNFNEQLKQYLNIEFEGTADLIYDYIICERALEWSEYCKKLTQLNHEAPARIKSFQ